MTLLTIHDANLKKVAFIDNEKQDTLNYFDDVWTRNLETGSSTFEFTVFKKSIDKAYSYLNEKAFVSFKHNGKSYVFSVMTVEENEQTITCYCENLNLELINEYTNSYKATKAMSFVEYCNAMGLLSFTYLSIGINEISDKKRTLEWEGQDTKLARLLSLANKFDAEIDFDTQLNADSTIKSFKVNVYHENDGTHQGVGRIRNDIRLTYGKNLKSITRKIDKTNVVNAIRPTGTKDGQTVVISGLSAWEEKNADGVVEFYQKGEMLYAPISMQMYPSTFTSETTKDQWTRKDITVDSDDQTVIRSAGIRELRKNAYPAITYDVDGFVDVEIGDTVKIHDDGFNPVLIVEARVADQKISFTNPQSNKTTFANFKALENQLSDGIQERLNELVEQTKPYTIKLSTNNGVVFKNNIGQSIVTPTLYRGGKPVVANVTWRWSLDGNVTTGMTYTVRGANVTDTATLTIAAYIGNDEVAVDEISFVNVLDGAMGTPGTPGKDGRTTYVHTAWANNATGTSGFSLDNSANKLYIGIYTDFEPADSTDSTKYKWTLIKGEKGDKGNDGLPGADGVGIRSTVITYGLSTSDSVQPTNWTTTVPNLVKGQYLWTKTVWTYTDSTTETGYTKTYIAKDGNSGTDGLPGKDGVGIKTTTITYAKSTNGATAPTSGWTASVPSAVAGDYIWTKTVWAYTDNTTETGYSVGKIGNTGPQGPSGKDGIAGKDGKGITGTVITYGISASETTQPTNWTTSVPTLVKGQYLWTKTVWTYTDSTSETGYTKTYIAKDGNSGTDGLPGKDGVGIRTTTITYGQSASGTTQPTTWTSQVPSVQDGLYLWTKTVWTYTDNTSETGYSVAKMGEAGPKGVPGDNAYFYVAYADRPDGSTGFNLTDSSKRYMGHYSSNSKTQSTSAASYKWIDRANVTATFVQSTAPENPPTGSRWKYTGSTVITANSSAITPGEQYLFIGGRWAKDVITSDNLQIKDQFINGPMIKNGAVTVGKLNVGDLSAISANLGSVNAGKMLLQRSFVAGRSAVPVYNYPAFNTGLFVDNYGLIVNGSPVQKFTTEATASDMPVVAVTSGEVRFLRTNLTNDIEEVLHTGLSDPDFGYIQFGRDSSGKNALIIEANGQIYLKGENYTDWAVSTIDNRVKWKVQGNLVIVDYDLSFTSGGNKHIVTIPTKYVPKALMLGASAWHALPTNDRKAQLNADGGLHILATDANQRYCGQIIWAY